jgi:hypothetical protein
MLLFDTFCENYGHFQKFFSWVIEVLSIHFRRFPHKYSFVVVFLDTAISWRGNETLRSLEQMWENVRKSNKFVASALQIVFQRVNFEWGNALNGLRCWG